MMELFHFYLLTYGGFIQFNASLTRVLWQNNKLLQENLNLLFDLLLSYFWNWLLNLKNLNFAGG